MDKKIEATILQYGMNRVFTRIMQKKMGTTT